MLREGVLDTQQWKEQRSTEEILKVAADSHIQQAIVGEKLVFLRVCELVLTKRASNKLINYTHTYLPIKVVC